MPRLNPPSTPRKAADIYDEMAAVASVALPEWSGSSKDGEFGFALLKAMAMMAERSSIGLSKTGGRDSIAFFNYLDVPAEPSRPATAALAFQLGDKQPASVNAPAGIQVGAATDGEEQVFETTSAVYIVQTRLDFLAAVDNEADRIEVAPRTFLEFVPEPFGLTRFTVPTLTRAGSEELQVEPPEGLAEGDYIRFAGDPNHRAVYRLGAGKEGLFQLLDPLDADIPAGAVLEKITNFEAFDLRNVQAHALFIGHKDLLNLEQPSEITITFEPANVAASLDGGLRWELFGTRVVDDEGNEATTWHEVHAASAVDGAIALTKHWPGGVDETEEPGEKSRWLRATWMDPITDRELTEPVRTIRLSVRSLGKDGVVAPPGDDACCQAVVGDPPASDAESGDDADKSISQAFHNNLPLPLTTRFYPFGPEPQRFDAFAVAAPEAFSKAGAQVKLEVQLSDASIRAFAVTESFAGDANGPRRSYAVGDNGQLQVLNFETIAPTWQDIGAPGPDDQRAESEAAPADRLLLAIDQKPQAIQWIVYNGIAYDAVVAIDDRRRLWLYAATWSGGPPLEYERGVWSEFAAPDAVVTDFVALRREPASGFAQVVVVAISGGGLVHSRALGGSFASRRATWEDVTPAGGPVLDANSRIVNLQESEWPEPTGTHRIVVLDEAGAPWIGELTFDAAGAATVAWTAIPDQGDPVDLSLDVRPVAYENSAGDIVVCGARLEAGVLNPRFVSFNGANTTVSPIADIVLQPGAEIHVDPTGFGNYGARIVMTGTINGSASAIQLRDTAVYASLALPAEVDDPAAITSFKVDSVPVMALGGGAENLFVQVLPDPVDVLTYWDALDLDVSQVGAHYREAAGQNAPQLLADMSDVTDLVISKGSHRIYNRPNAFQVGQWTLWEESSLSFNLTVIGASPTTEMKVDGQDAPPDDSEFLFDDGNEKRRYTMVGAANDLNADPNNPDWRINMSVDVAGLGGGPLAFDVIDKVDDIDVTSRHEGTLLEIRSYSLTAGDPEKLSFNMPTPTADPPEQTFGELYDETSGSLWILVDDAWNTNPGLGELVELSNSNTDQLEAYAYPRNFQNPELAWEYFDGEGWRRFEAGFIDQTENFARSGDISFPVPAALSLVEIAGQEDYFIRARLIGGDYGRPVYKVESETVSGVTTQSVTVDTSGLQPPEIRSIKATFRLDDKREPESVRVSNNLTLRDQTQAAASDSAVFDLFTGARDLDNADGDSSGRSLYFGFTRNFGPGTLAMYVDAVDIAGDEESVFEVLTRDGWRDTPVADESVGMRRRGFVRVSVDATPVLTRLFGKDQFWLRVRLADSAAPWQPVLRSSVINAAPAIQAKTTVQELLGSSIGEPEQSFALANQKVLPDSLELRVRENLTEEEREALIRDCGSDVIATYEAIDLEGDWVAWQRVDSFVGFGAEDRVFRLDADAGVVRFGADTRKPPAGRDNIRAIRYRSGGGTTGNVLAHTINGLKSAVRGVENVTNPVAASGGTDTPGVDGQLKDSPSLVRRAERALMPVDIESLVVSSSPDRVRAKCVVPVRQEDPIRIAVAQRGVTRCPMLGLADRQGIEQLVRDAGWGALDDDSISVEDPTYVPVHVRVVLSPTEVERAAGLRADSIRALKRLLDPIDGGPRGSGWPFGRSISRSDVQRALAQLHDLDVIRELHIERRDGQSLDAMPATGMICASANDIEVAVSLDQPDCTAGDAS